MVDTIPQYEKYTCSISLFQGFFLLVCDFWLLMTQSCPTEHYAHPESSTQNVERHSFYFFKSFYGTELEKMIGFIWRISSFALMELLGGPSWAGVEIYVGAKHHIGLHNCTASHPAALASTW